MLKMQLGLTKAYNLFHDRELSAELVAKESKQPVPVAESAQADLLQLRALHVQMDEAVLAAYGWSDIPVPPYCPKTDEDKASLQTFEDEVIDRLFLLNAARAEQEKQTAPPAKPARPRAGKPAAETAPTGKRAAKPAKKADKPRATATGTLPGFDDERES